MKTWKQLADSLNEVRNPERCSKVSVDADGRGITWTLIPATERGIRVNVKENEGFEDCILTINGEARGEVGKVDVVKGLRPGVESTWNLREPRK